MAATLAVAVGDVAEPLVAELARRLPTIKVGPGWAPDTTMGPVVSAESRDRIREMIAEGVEDGAVLVVDGREVPAELEGGFFVAPTLFDHVRPGMRVYDEEIFGPVLGVVRVASLDAALELIEANQYGNGAAVFTRSGPAARAFQRRASAGMVGINVPIPVPVNSFATGGWKSSVFGAHGLLGQEAFRFYTHQKVVTARWPDDTGSAMNLAFTPNQ
jgi:malonate-semialdehyde dehydrogenase (acetylating)/methylmalonate-semialdehyde dehydrogenase